MNESTSRQFSVSLTKGLFDQLIDRHAEAYLEAYPEIKEFSNYEKSGTFKYYIGMIYTNFYEKPDDEQIKIRGSLNMTKNQILELDLSAVDSFQTFFPGQIVAFYAEPFLKQRVSVKKFLDPMRIAPRMKKINTVEPINLLVASGPFMNANQEDWTLYDSLIRTIKSSQATHVILFGPFVDMDNKLLRAHFEANWRLVIDKLVGALHDLECRIHLVPSQRDILPNNLSSNYFYPTAPINFKMNLKEGVTPKCQIVSVSDPAQIDLGGLYVDVTSAEVLFHMNRVTRSINQKGENIFTSIYRHLLAQGIYPLYPTPANEIAVDHSKLGKVLTLDRLGPHIMVLPTKFTTDVVNVDNRLVVTVHKCSIKKHCVLIKIPKIEEEIDSVLMTNYSHEIIDLTKDKNGVLTDQN